MTRKQPKPSSRSSGESADRPVVVIGAGVVGLACARALAGAGHRVLVLEREARHGRGTSSRSSGVIHAGIYYRAGSLKAALCVEGRERLYAYARQRGIPHRRCGKLIVATSRAELPALARLQLQAAKNGVELELMGSLELRRRAPGVAGESALWSPETGIIDAHAYMDALAGDAACDIVGRARVVGAERVEEGWRLTVQRGQEDSGTAGEDVSSTSQRGQRDSGTVGEGATSTSRAAATATAAADVEAGDEVAAVSRSPAVPLSQSAVETLDASVVVNAAGLYSDEVAGLVLPAAEARALGLEWSKGNYFAIRPGAALPLGCLVYPCPQPEKHTLGVHLTLDLDGGQRLGPDVEALPGRVEDYSVDPARGAAFLEAARRYLPQLAPGDLAPAYAGIRPTRRLEGYGDFYIAEESTHGAPGWVNLVGIDSPGLTAALAIGERVRALVEGVSASAG